MRAALVRVRDLIAREPVVVRTVIGLVVAGALVWGVDIADLGERVAQTVEIIAAIVAALGIAWGRQGSAPMRDVVAIVAPDGTTVAGPASPRPDGTPLTFGLTDERRDALVEARYRLPAGDAGREAISQVLVEARHLADSGARPSAPRGD